MMKLSVKLDNTEFADGQYQIRAKGCIMVSLHWANLNGILQDWTAFAYLPVSPAGAAAFRYQGNRAIPAEATHVAAKGISADYVTIDECSVELPRHKKSEKEKCLVRAAVMSDLHITNKTGRLMWALDRVKERKPDILLLSGDLVNDGTPEQFSLLQKSILDLKNKIPVFCCAGNHDYPHDQASPVPYGYYNFCSWLREWNKECGIEVQEHENGASTFRFGEIDFVSLNAVTYGRNISFSDGAQIKWLCEHLEHSHAKWHILLCHAPLAGHNPQRRNGSEMPYFAKDKQLQDVIDANRNVIFISGHTHVSFNIPWGCVEYVKEKNNLYLNAGSICPTDLKDAEPLMPTEWVDGNVTELSVGNCQVEIKGFLLHSNKKISRGYYKWGGIVCDGNVGTI